MDYFIKLERCVTGFSIDDCYVNCISNDSVYKIDKQSKEIVCSLKLFQKEGFSRDLIANEKLLIIRDFCTLHILDKADYTLLATLELGQDLSSDICGMAIDKSNIYACIRNGAITVIDIHTFQIKSTYPISNSSLWELRSYKNTLIGGDTKGNLLYIDKNTM